jgi:hypothetical protein
MDYKIERLLHEGFSIKTLGMFNDTQVNVLYERIKKEKEVGEQVDMVVKKDDIKKPETASALEKLPPGTKVTIETEMTEKAVSKQQQKIMGLALSVKRGDTKKSKVSKKVKDMADDMSEKDLEDFASTKHKGLPKKRPTKKEDVKGLEESIMNLIKNHLPPHTTKGELLMAVRRNNK